MYRIPEPKIIGDFSPPDSQDLKEKYGIGELPREAWVGENWAKGLEQEHPSGTKIRVEEGPRAPLPERLARSVSQWHTDIAGGPGGRGVPVATVIGAMPTAPIALSGIIPEVASKEDGGVFELARLTKEALEGSTVLHKLAEKAIKLGDAVPVPLESGVLYLLPEGLLHTRTTDDSLRVVAQSHPGLAADPLWLAFQQSQRQRAEV